MTIKFPAEDIHTERTDDHILVGFADSTNEVRQFIVVMRVLRGADQVPDEIVGQPYFEYLDEQQSGYGCIAMITLRADQVTIKIDRAKCPDVSDSEFIATINVDRSRRQEISDHLSDILKGAATLKIIAD